MILCAGAPGRLGGAIVRELCRKGKKLRCVVRKTSDTSFLQSVPVERVCGDVRDKQFVESALSGVDTVISSFTTDIIKDPRVAALWENDYEGNRCLIACAKQSGVKKFVFVSYWGLAKFGNFEHGKIKKLVEDLLLVSGIDYTVFRVTTLATDMSLLLGNRLKNKGWAPMFMNKHEKVRPILLEDLAWCIADSLDNAAASYSTIEVAGEEEYSFIELQDLFCRVLAKKVRFVFIPLPLACFAASVIDVLTNGKYNARGIVSAFTGGSTCDIRAMKKVFRFRQGSFAKHLDDYARTGKALFQERKENI